MYNYSIICLETQGGQKALKTIARPENTTFSANNVDIVNVTYCTSI